MSAETWLKEFYPVEAHHVTWEEALDHSIRKWTGLRSKNMKRHRLKFSEMNYRFLHDTEHDRIFLSIDAGSCALCVHHDFDERYNCRSCPLAKSRGGVPCDSRTFEEQTACRLSPYSEFVERGNPEPMIAALLEAKLRILDSEPHHVTFKRVRESLSYYQPGF